MSMFGRGCDDDDGPAFTGYSPNPLTNLMAFALVLVFILQACSHGGGLIALRETPAEALADPKIRAWLVGPFTRDLSLEPASALRGQVWRLLTSSVLHHPPLPDVAWGMYFLVIWNVAVYWLVGRAMERDSGGGEAFLFGCAAGVAGNAFAVAAVLLLPNFGPPAAVYASPSGVIFAFLVAAAMRYPVTYIGRMRVPTWGIAAVYAVLSLGLFLLGLRTGEHPAMLAGGAAFAALYVVNRWRLRGLWQALGESGPEGRPGPRPYRPAASAPEDPRVDAVLAKMAREGKDSLTRAEWDILHAASERARRR